jgi:hypothetical protein
LHAFGNRLGIGAVLVTRIGKDARGERLHAAMQARPISRRRPAR